MIDMEKRQYNIWLELFKIHARAYLVNDHMIMSMEYTTVPILKETNPKLWLRFDVIDLQWIYGTIFDDFL